MIEQVKKQCTILRLHGFNENAELRANEAQLSSQTYLDFLQILLEDELLHRKNAKAKRLISKAKFRYDCDLEDWDDSYERGINKTKMKQLSLLGFHKNMENLIILGRTGEGKTHLAMSLGKRLCAEGITTQFYSVNLFFEEVNAAKASGKYLNLIKKLSRTPVIILDDFGLRAYTHEEATILMDILEDRYRKGTVMVTSQVDPRGWSKLFEDPVIAEAINDRLTKPSMTIKLKGGSYRDKLKVS